MPQGLILAIDQGTTNTKVAAFDTNGILRCLASRSVPIRYPRPAWVEQDGSEVWQSVTEATRELLDSLRPAPILAIGIANQRESVIAWNRRTGIAVGPLVSWQCRRTAELCEKIQASGAGNLIRSRSGLPIDPLFSATKIRWILDNVEDARSLATRGNLCVGTVDSWLLWNLTAGSAHVCDASNAARTQLFDISKSVWDEELLDVFGLTQGILPEVHSSGEIFGHTSGLPELEGVPIASMIGDSHAALFAHGCYEPGPVKATYGTGTSLMSITDTAVESRSGLSTTIAWSLKQKVFALEGNISATGAALQWLGEVLGLDEPGVGVEDLARKVDTTQGVHFVPALVGLGAPYWDSAARGTISGLTRATTSSHLARAALEAVAFQVRDVVDCMGAETGRRPAVLFADGGSSRSDLMMQIQADIAGIPVRRAAVPELSAVGAALIAGISIGLWDSEHEAASLIQHSDPFEPAIEEHERERLYAGWRQAVKRTLSSEDAGWAGTASGRANPR